LGRLEVPNKMDTDRLVVSVGEMWREKTLSQKNVPTLKQYSFKL